MRIDLEEFAEANLVSGKGKSLYAYLKWDSEMLGLDRSTAVSYSLLEALACLYENDARFSQTKGEFLVFVVQLLNSLLERPQK